MIPEIKNWIKNSWKFRKSLSQYQPWDYGFIELVASEMYADTATYIRDRGHFVGHKKTARRGFIVAGLLKRRDSPQLSKYHSKLLSDWWDSRNETTLRDGCVSMEWVTNSLSRRLEKEDIKYNARLKHEKQLLIKYLIKYHERLWD